MTLATERLRGEPLAEKHAAELARMYADPGVMGTLGGVPRCEVEGEGEVKIAWAIRPEWQGRGLATEMARRCVEVGLGEFGLGSVVAFSTPENTASRRVMEKSGLVFERSFDRAEWGTCCTGGGLSRRRRSERSRSGRRARGWFRARREI